MASSEEYARYVCERLMPCGSIRYRKMFGEYMVYVDDKPMVLVCDNVPYVDIHESIVHLMADAEQDYPYPSAKLHYVLDIDNADLVAQVIAALLPHKQLPKSARKKVDKLP